PGGGETGDRNREARAHTVLGKDVRRLVPEQLEPALAEDQQRGRVAADRHECGMAERDLSAIAREDVETEQGNEIDSDVRELPEAELARKPRQQPDQQDRGGQHESSEGRGAPATHQTFLTTTRPKRPDGRITSTSNKMARAVGSLSSCPTKSTYAPSRLMTTPIRRPPTTAPTGLSIPPRTAAANA